MLPSQQQQQQQQLSSETWLSTQDRQKITNARQYEVLTCPSYSVDAWKELFYFSVDTFGNKADVDFPQRPVQVLVNALESYDDYRGIEDYLDSFLGNQRRQARRLYVQKVVQTQTSVASSRWRPLSEHLARLVADVDAAAVQCSSTDKQRQTAKRFSEQDVAAMLAMVAVQ